MGISQLLPRTLVEEQLNGLAHTQEPEAEGLLRVRVLSELYSDFKATQYRGPVLKPRKTRRRSAGAPSPGRTDGGVA